MSGRAAQILGIGMVSALGSGFAASGKAYAAGERSFRRVPSLMGVDGLPVSLGEVLPYEAVRDYTDRLARLSQAAWEDLAARVPLPSGAVFLAALDSWVETSPLKNALRAAVAAPARPHTARGHVVYGGPAEALALLGQAARMVREGEAEAVIVAAVSSALSAELLDRRAIDGRILSKSNPYGGFPSEAACVFLVGAAPPGTTPWGEVLGVLEGQEQAPLDNPTGLRGRALADLCRAVVSRITPDRLLVDLTGERWRAEELGFAAGAAGPAIADLCADVEAPCLYLGDCESALGLALPALAFAARPQRSGGAVSRPMPRQALVLAASRGGKRCALMLGIGTEARG